MTHDLQAAWASAEVASIIKARPTNFFHTPPHSQGLSVFAVREGKSRWPHADGVVTVEDATAASTKKYNIAIEFKRENEGVHGILTALGQAHAYLHKGYHASAIVIPRAYDTLPAPGPYVCEVLAEVCNSRRIGVFAYSEPDPSNASPFREKLELVKNLIVDHAALPTTAPQVRTVESQFSHLREGSSDPDAFFRYLHAVKTVGTGAPTLPNLPAELVGAVERIQAGVNPHQYLANVTGPGFPDNVWMQFWFNDAIPPAAMRLWSETAPPYTADSTASNVLKPDGHPKMFFAGRVNSPKNRLTAAVNAGTKTPDEAWEEFAINVRKRSHSYREDIDSGLEHIGFLDSAGRITPEGFQFLDAAERAGTANTGTAKALLGSAILSEGQWGAFLHYAFRLSESRFRTNPLEFAMNPGSPPKFDKREYLSWLEDQLANTLKVWRKVSARGGQARQPFQELAVLRNLGYVGGFRIGVGLEINWPEVQTALERAHQQLN